jgi:hypothetical protein
MDDEPSMSQFASKADYDAAADAAELKRLRAMFAAATEIQGDDEVLKYVTSGNAIPVTRCTVSADLIRQLVARSAEGRRAQWVADLEDLNRRIGDLRVKHGADPNETLDQWIARLAGGTPSVTMVYCGTCNRDMPSGVYCGRCGRMITAPQSAIAAIPHVNQLKKFAGEVTGVGAVVMGDSAIVEAYRAMLRTADSGI